MTGNNSCGTRSIRYGIMRDNVLAIDAILADGTRGALRRGGAQSRAACIIVLPPPCGEGGAKRGWGDMPAGERGYPHP